MVVVEQYLELEKETVYGTDAATLNDATFDPLEVSMDTETGPRLVESIGNPYFEKFRQMVEKGVGGWRQVTEPNNGILALLHFATGKSPSGVVKDVTSFDFTFTGAMEGELPSFTARIGDRAGAIVHTGRVIKSLEFAGGADAFTILTVDSVGQGEDDAFGSLTTTPPFSDFNGWDQSDATIEFDNVANNCISEWTVLIENNIKEDDFTVGSLQYQKVPLPMRRRVSGTLNLTRLDTGLRTTFLTGGTVRLEFNHTLLIGSVNYELNILIPKAVLDSSVNNQSSRDINPHAVSWVALFDDTTENSEIVILITSDETMP